MRRAKIERNDKAIVRLKVDRQSQIPIYRQIYERICDAIAKGVLRPGERLPSARSLASQLTTSRGTVDLAYSLLAGEGYVLSMGPAGTMVASAPSGAVKPASQSTKPSALAVRPFQLGLPALDVFPRKLWSRLAAKHARDLPVHALGVPDPVGYRPLREAIASYLAVSRGIVCSTEQVIVTSGFQGALGMITRAFLHPGDVVWFEDPGYFMARMGLEAAGATIMPVSVDNDGLDVAAAIARSPGARLAYVTPSHQAPMGVSLSSSRRLELLSWAADTKAWILEDDYDSEFRYGSRPLPALKSLDEAGRVLYVGSFSKVLFPGLRLGYLVVPESQIERMNRICLLLYRDRPVFNQAVVADFMTEGHFGRHIQRMRSLYSHRRSALAAALSEVFDGGMRIELREGGMHLLARMTGIRSDLDLVARATARGLAPAALSPWGVRSDQEQGLLLSFTNIAEERAVDLARQLKVATAPQ
jgi:GntR family transcriptional regulator/MocR family aminotransferase